MSSGFLSKELVIREEAVVVPNRLPIDDFVVVTGSGSGSRLPYLLPKLVVVLVVTEVEVLVSFLSSRSRSPKRDLIEVLVKLFDVSTSLFKVDVLLVEIMLDEVVCLAGAAGGGGVGSGSGSLSSLSSSSPGESSFSSSSPSLLSLSTLNEPLFCFRNFARAPFTAGLGGWFLRISIAYFSLVKLLKMKIKIQYS